MTGRVYDIIDGLNVGRDWKLTFKKIHIAYHKNYAQGSKVDPILWVPCPEIANLPLKLRVKLFTKFNPLGLLFGPLYYLINGFYLKGCVLLAIFMCLMCIDNATRFMTLFVLMYCAVSINVDFFKKKVLEHPEIKSNPLIIGNDFDENILEKLLSQKTSILPYLFLLLSILSPIAYEIVKSSQDSKELKSLVMEPIQVCKDKKTCLDTIKTYVKKINSTNNKKEISDSYYKIALTYFSLGDNINTIKNATDAITFNKNHTNAYLLRAKAYLKMNNNFQSILDYKEALKINPKAIFLNYYIGFNYYALGKYDKALEYFEKVTKKYNDPSYFEAQGYARYMLKDKEGAIKDIKKAMILYNRLQNKDKVDKLRDYLKTIEK